MPLINQEPRCKILKAMSDTGPMSREICLICKGGRLLCGQPSCPLLQRLRIQAPLKEKLSDALRRSFDTKGVELSESISGPSPSIFVGWQNYPNIFVGPLTALEPEKSEILDNPAQWYGKNFDEIIEMRSSLVRSKMMQNVKERSKFIEKSQEIALSIKPTEIEAEFKSKPTYKISFSAVTQPMGPSGVIKNFKLTENPKIPGRVDSIVSDELNSREAAIELFRSGFDVYYLTTVLSSGILGIEDKKRLVPTRWSITAIDDIIAKELMREIRSCQLINEFLVFSNTYLENHFEILLIPGMWEFEQFEAWAPKTLWTISSNKEIIQ